MDLCLFLSCAQLFYWDLTGLGKFLANRKFPEAARKMGFKLKVKGGSPRNLGIYTGKYKGHFVRLDPEGAKIEVSMKHIQNLELSTVNKEANFDTGRKGFDYFLTERKASPEIARKLCEFPELLNYVDRFRKTWKRKIEYLYVTYNRIECKLRYGYGHYIPPGILKRILPDLITLADLLQDTVRANNQTKSN